MKIKLWAGDEIEVKHLKTLKLEKVYASWKVSCNRGIVGYYTTKEEAKVEFWRLVHGFSRKGVKKW